MNPLKVKIRIEREETIHFPYYFRYEMKGSVTFGKIDNGKVYSVDVNVSGPYRYCLQIDTFDPNQIGSFFDERNKSSDSEWFGVWTNLLHEFNISMIDID